jgi:uncharacterized coiled-coil DUF342 family protein
MSKNLRKASEWIHRQIDDLEAECLELRNQAKLLNARADELELQIGELNEVLNKLPVDSTPEPQIVQTP